MRWLNFFRLRNAAKTVFAIAWMYIAVGIALCRRRANFIVERHTGDGNLAGAKRVAAFVHYDRRGRLHDYVLYYLKCLRGAGFEIVFVSNAPLLPAESVAKLKPLCALILRRKNIGYDFAAYKDAIGTVGNVADLDELLLVNDSVYGPFEDMAAIISRCDPERAAVWGITDSWFRRFHLQSYFLLFTRPALTSEIFARFWKNVRYVQSKRWIIEKYEIGLSRAMIQNELRCAALYPYRRVAQALMTFVADMRKEAQADDNPREPVWTEQQKFATNLSGAVELGLPLNSTHHLWDYLIGELACPFLKRELLERNPMNVPSLQRWETVLRGTFNYDTDLILRHLEAQARNRAV
jgi:lipopolysaccharide biosynthesis protein